MRSSLASMSMWIESSTSGMTKTAANEVWRRLLASNGRDAHQAVDADLLLQVAEGELALVAHGDALDARLFAGQDVGDLGLEAQALAEAQVHAQQDLGPVLALGAAGAGMDAQEGVAGVAVRR